MVTFGTSLNLQSQNKKYILMNWTRKFYSTIVGSSTPSVSVAMGQRVGLPEPIMTIGQLEALISEKLASLPYFVERTSYGHGLPVYNDIRNGRTRRLTIIRRIYGDIQALAAALRVEFPDIRKMEVRPVQQKIVIKGDMVQEVKLFLTDLGF